MQFDRDASGKLTPLPRPSIDTGMGLERIAAVLQGKLSNYDTDLLRPIIDARGRAVREARTAKTTATDTVLRINADHARATAFLIHDGVLPSNEGRGYVLRKIMRRAMRNARMVGRDGSISVQADRLRRRADARRLSGDDGERPARGARGEGRRASLRDHVPGGREGLPGRGEIGGRRRAAGRRGVQAVRHLRPGARRAGRDGARARARRSIAKASRRRWRSSARARAPVGKAPTRRRSHPVYQALPQTEFVGRETLEAPAKVAGGAATAKSRWTARRSMPRPAARWATRACWFRRRPARRLRVVESTYKRAPGKTVHKVKLLVPVKEGEIVIAKVDPASRNPPCATTPARICCTPRCARSGHAREAGRQRGRTRAAALRFHALHGAGPR